LHGKFARRMTLFPCVFRMCLVLLSAGTVPWGSWRLGPREFIDSRHMKVVRLSALRSGRLYPSAYIPCAHFHQRLCRAQGRSAVEGLSQGKIPVTRDLPASSAVPQPTALPRTPRRKVTSNRRVFTMFCDVTLFNLVDKH
jgi:hypothetical protein